MGGQTITMMRLRRLESVCAGFNFKPIQNPIVTSAGWLGGLKGWGVGLGAPSPNGWPDNRCGQILSIASREGLEGLQEASVRDLLPGRLRTFAAKDFFPG
jgi:hypothetical protein